MGPLGVPLLSGRPFTLEDLFANGAYAGFDFTDLDPAKTWGADAIGLLRQDASGALVTASGQPVGQAFDKSQSLALGAELVTNGDFGSAVGWTVDADWSIGSGVATKVAGAGNADLTRAVTAAAGDAYRYALEVTQRTAGAFFPAHPFLDTGNTAQAAGSFVWTSIGATANSVKVRGNAAAAGVVDSVSVKRIGGNHASQSTSAARPAYTESGALKYLNFDGIDDELRSTLLPAASMTVAVCGRVASASKVIMGSNAAANTRSYISTNTAGQFSAGVGADGFDTVCGGADVRGTDFVGLLRFNGTVVELWVNGSRVYQGALNGVPNTTIAYALGCLNNNGATSNFADGRIYRAVAVQRFIPDADVIPLMRALGQGVVSF